MDIPTPRLITFILNLRDESLQRNQKLIERINKAVDPLAKQFEEKQLQIKELIARNEFENSICEKLNRNTTIKSLNTQCNLLEKEIDSEVSRIYNSEFNTCNMKSVDINFGFNHLAIYGKQDPNQHCMFTHVGMELAMRLDKVIYEISRNNSSSKLENALRLFIPEILICNETMYSLKRALISPRPSKADKFSKRYLHAISDQREFSKLYKVNFSEIRSMIMELVQTIDFYSKSQEQLSRWHRPGSQIYNFNTGNRELDFLLNRAISYESSNLSIILERNKINVKQELAKENHSIVKTSMQKKLVRLNLTPQAA